MSGGAHPYVAREGWLFIAAMALSGFAAKFYFGLLVALPLWFLCLMLVYQFRDPERAIPSAPLGVVSPVDGRIVAIEPVRDHYLARDAIRVSIRMNRLGSYTTRAPVEGKIVQHWYEPATQSRVSGNRHNAAMEHYAMWLQTDENDDVVLVMGVTCRALKPICYHQSGERIGQGERCGLVRFGGYIEVLLPANSRVEVVEGDQVMAGSGLLAMLVHQVAPEAPQLWGHGNSAYKGSVS